MYQRLDLAYMAGFFDGEGSIGVYGRGGKHGFGLRTQLTQNVGPASTRLLESFKDTFGGNLSVHRTLTDRPCYNWQLNSEKAVDMLLDILPYLVLKREQAEIAIAWQTSRPPIKRNTRGHITRSEHGLEVYNRQIVEIVKLLKFSTIDQLITERNDLRDAIRKLQTCVKG